MLRSVWMILFVLLVSGCVEKSTSELANTIKADSSKTYRDSFNIRGKILPLPQGEWKIIACGNDNEKFFYVFLLQEYPGKIFDLISVQVDTIELDREHGYVIDKDLDRTDMLRVNKNKNIAGEPIDGWFINNFLPKFVPDENSAQVFKEVSKYISYHKLIIPNDMILVCHLITGTHPHKKRLLRVKYYYNPETAGFAESPKTDWARSDWNAVRINTDTRKVAFIDELAKKHAHIHEMIKNGFHK